MLVDGYSSDEINSTTGGSMNYLSAKQMAELVDLPNNSTIPNRAPLQLKSLLGNSFTTIHGRTKTTQNNYIKLNLWDSASAASFFLYHAFQGNQKAQAICAALTATSLDIIIDDAFGREYIKDAARKRTDARLKGKLVRRTLTDAIIDWIELHCPNLDKTRRALLFAQTTDIINQGVMARTSKEIKIEWNCTNPRDDMSEQALYYIKVAEDLTTRLLDSQGDHYSPVGAARKAVKDLLIPVQTR